VAVINMSRAFRALSRVCLLAFVLLAATSGHAQTRSATGQNIFPVFEGWLANPDGTFDMLFGYVNRNYEEVLDIPVGPNNSVEPGGPDQGQPSHFFPRRSMFTFRVRVPKDFGNKEVVWSLTIRGKTEKAYATLKPEYILDKLMMMKNDGGFGERPEETKNEAPLVRVEGSLTRTAKVGQPLSLSAFVLDDGIPEARQSVRSGGDGGSVIATGGLRAGWFVYRGVGPVSFAPAHGHPGPKPYGNSAGAVRIGKPLLPPLRPAADGSVTASATFGEPGSYTLQFMAHDGGLASTQNVTVTVTP
jgi:hypothetical protein